MAVINSTSRIPKHIQVANLLKGRIEKGLYPPEKHLPPVRVLGSEFGVSQNAVQRALRVLAKEGVVQPQRSVGVRVLRQDRRKTTPLTFGMVYPFPADSSFAGTIHCMAEKAIDYQDNYYIIKGSDGDPQKEREIVEHFLAMGLEGLMIWPAAGEQNVPFFREIAERIPTVFIDRTFEELPVPGVTIDWTRMGEDVVQYLARQGLRRTLILEEPIAVSSFRQMYSAMREMVKTISAEERFTFVEFGANAFLETYQENPLQAVEELHARLGHILSTNDVEAFFFPHDEIVDSVYACTDLARNYPMRSIASLTNTLPTRRSIPFYKLQCREWVCDFEAMIRKATEMLHEIVFLNSRLHREVKIRAASTIRTSDKLFEITSPKRPDQHKETVV